MDAEELNELTHEIIGAAIEVHKALGPGLLESAYETCLCYELSQRGIKFQRQVPVPIVYKSVKLETAFRLDLLVESAVIVEIKSREELARIDGQQLLSHLRLMHLPVGLLINFNVRVLIEGVRRIVNDFPAVSASLRAPR